MKGYTFYQKQLEINKIINKESCKNVQLIIPNLVPFLLIVLIIPLKNVLSLDLQVNNSSKELIDDSLLQASRNNSDAGTPEIKDILDISLPTFESRKKHLTNIYLENRSSIHPKLKGSPRNTKVLTKEIHNKEKKKVPAVEEKGDLLDLIFNHIIKLSPEKSLNVTKDDLKDLVAIEEFKNPFLKSNVNLTNDLKNQIENLENIRKKRLLLHQLPGESYFADYSSLLNANPSAYDQTIFQDNGNFYDQGIPEIDPNNPSVVHSLPPRIPDLNQFNPYLDYSNPGVYNYGSSGLSPDGQPLDPSLFYSTTPQPELVSSNGYLPSSTPFPYVELQQFQVTPDPYQVGDDAFENDFGSVIKHNPNYISTTPQPDTNVVSFLPPFPQGPQQFFPNPQDGHFITDEVQQQIPALDPLVLQEFLALDLETQFKVLASDVVLQQQFLTLDPNLQQEILAQNPLLQKQPEPLHDSLAFSQQFNPVPQEQFLNDQEGGFLAQDQIIDSQFNPSQGIYPQEFITQEFLDQFLNLDPSVQQQLLEQNPALQQFFLDPNIQPQFQDPSTQFQDPNSQLQFQDPNTQLQFQDPQYLPQSPNSNLPLYEPLSISPLLPDLSDVSQLPPLGQNFPVVSHPISQLTPQSLHHPEVSQLPFLHHSIQYQPLLPDVHKHSPDYIATTPLPNPEDISILHPLDANQLINAHLSGSTPSPLHFSTLDPNSPIEVSSLAPPLLSPTEISSLPRVPPGIFIHTHADPHPQSNYPFQPNEAFQPLVDVTTAFPEISLPGQDPLYHFSTPVPTTPGAPPSLNYPNYDYNIDYNEGLVDPALNQYGPTPTPQVGLQGLIQGQDLFFRHQSHLSPDYTGEGVPQNGIDPSSSYLPPLPSYGPPLLPTGDELPLPAYGEILPESPLPSYDSQPVPEEPLLPEYQPQHHQELLEPILPHEPQNGQFVSFEPEVHHLGSPVADPGSFSYAFTQNENGPHLPFQTLAAAIDQSLPQLIQVPETVANLNHQPPQQSTPPPTFRPDPFTRTPIPQRLQDKNQPESLRNPQRGNLPSRGTIKPGPDNETSKKPAEIPSSGRARNATTASSARLKSRPSSDTQKEIVSGEVLENEEPEFVSKFQDFPVFNDGFGKGLKSKKPSKNRIKDEPPTSKPPHVSSEDGSSEELNSSLEDGHRNNLLDSSEEEEKVTTTKKPKSRAHTTSPRPRKIKVTDPPSEEVEDLPTTTTTTTAKPTQKSKKKGSKRLENLEEKPSTKQPATTTTTTTSTTTLASKTVPTRSKLKTKTTRRQKVKTTTTPIPQVETTTEEVIPEPVVTDKPQDIFDEVEDNFTTTETPSSTTTEPELTFGNLISTVSPRDFEQPATTTFSTFQEDSSIELTTVTNQPIAITEKPFRVISETPTSLPIRPKTLRPQRPTTSPINTLFKIASTFKPLNGFPNSRRPLKTATTAPPLLRLPKFFESPKPRSTKRPLKTAPQTTTYFPVVVDPVPTTTTPLPTTTTTPPPPSTSTLPPVDETTSFPTNFEGVTFYPFTDQESHQDLIIKPEPDLISNPEPILNNTYIFVNMTNPKDKTDDQEIAYIVKLKSFQNAVREPKQHISSSEEYDLESREENASILSPSVQNQVKIDSKFEKLTGTTTPTPVSQALNRFFGIDSELENSTLAFVTDSTFGDLTTTEDSNEQKLVPKRSQSILQTASPPSGAGGSYFVYTVLGDKQHKTSYSIDFANGTVDTDFTYPTQYEYLPSQVVQGVPPADVELLYQPQPQEDTFPKLQSSYLPPPSESYSYQQDPYQIYNEEFDLPGLGQVPQSSNYVPVEDAEQPYYFNQPDVILGTEPGLLEFSTQDYNYQPVVHNPALSDNGFHAESYQYQSFEPLTADNEFPLTPTPDPYLDNFESVPITILRDESSFRITSPNGHFDNFNIEGNVPASQEGQFLGETFRSFSNTEKPLDQSTFDIQPTLNSNILPSVNFTSFFDQTTFGPTITEQDGQERSQLTEQDRTLSLKNKIESINGIRPNNFNVENPTKSVQSSPLSLPVTSTTSRPATSRTTPKSTTRTTIRVKTTTTITTTSTLSTTTTSTLPTTVKIKTTTRSTTTTATTTTATTTIATTTTATTTTATTTTPPLTSSIATVKVFHGQVHPVPLPRQPPRKATPTSEHRFVPRINDVNRIVPPQSQQPTFEVDKEPINEQEQFRSSGQEFLNQNAPSINSNQSPPFESEKQFQRQPSRPVPSVNNHNRIPSHQPNRDSAFGQEKFRATEKGFLNQNSPGVITSQFPPGPKKAIPLARQPLRKANPTPQHRSTSIVNNHNQIPFQEPIFEIDQESNVDQEKFKPFGEEFFDEEEPEITSTIFPLDENNTIQPLRQAPRKATQASEQRPIQRLNNHNQIPFPQIQKPIFEADQKPILNHEQFRSTTKQFFYQDTPTTFSPEDEIPVTTFANIQSPGRFSNQHVPIRPLNGFIKNLEPNLKSSFVDATQRDSFGQEDSGQLEQDISFEPETSSNFDFASEEQTTEHNFQTPIFSESLTSPFPLIDADVVQSESETLFPNEAFPDSSTEPLLLTLAPFRVEQFLTSDAKKVEETIQEIYKDQVFVGTEPSSIQRQEKPHPHVSNPEHPIEETRSLNVSHRENSPRISTSTEKSLDFISKEDEDNKLVKANRRRPVKVVKNDRRFESSSEEDIKIELFNGVSIVQIEPDQSKAPSSTTIQPEFLRLNQNEVPAIIQLHGTKKVAETISQGAGRDRLVKIGNNVRLSATQQHQNQVRHRKPKFGKKVELSPVDLEATFQHTNVEEGIKVDKSQLFLSRRPQGGNQVLPEPEFLKQRFELPIIPLVSSESSLLLEDDFSVPPKLNVVRSTTTTQDPNIFEVIPDHLRSTQGDFETLPSTTPGPDFTRISFNATSPIPGVDLTREATSTTTTETTTTTTEPPPPTTQSSSTSSIEPTTMIESTTTTTESTTSTTESTSTTPETTTTTTEQTSTTSEFSTTESTTTAEPSTTTTTESTTSSTEPTTTTTTVSTTTSTEPTTTSTTTTESTTTTSESTTTSTEPSITSSESTTTTSEATTPELTTSTTESPTITSEPITMTTISTSTITTAEPTTTTPAPTSSTSLTPEQPTTIILNEPQNISTSTTTQTSPPSTESNKVSDPTSESVKPIEIITDIPETISKTEKTITSDEDEMTTQSVDSEPSALENDSSTNNVSVESEISTPAETEKVETSDSMSPDNANTEDKTKQNPEEFLDTKKNLEESQSIEVEMSQQEKEDKEGILKQLKSLDHVEWLIDNETNEVDDARPERDIPENVDLLATTVIPEIVLE